MAYWRFIITVEAQDDLERLDDETRIRVLKKLKWFADNFDQATPFPLAGTWKGFFKLRVGDWRIIYEAEEDKNLIIIHLIDHRNRIYRRKK